MKNTILLLIGGVILVTIVGYFVTEYNLSVSSPTEVISDVMNKSDSSRCEYDEDGRHVVVFIKGVKTRSDVTTGESSMSMIYRDSTLWSWDNTTKEGLMVKSPEATPVDGKQAEKIKERAIPRETEQTNLELEKHKDSCKNAEVADTLFEPPTDVEFQSYYELMEKQRMEPGEVKKYLQQ